MPDLSFEILSMKKHFMVSVNQMWYTNFLPDISCVLLEGTQYCSPSIPKFDLTEKQKDTWVKCSLIFHLLSCKRLRSTQWLLILQVHTSTEELFPFCAHVSGPYSTGERTSLFIILFSTIFFSHLCQCLCPLHYTTQLNKRCKLQVLQQVQ